WACEWRQRSRPGKRIAETDPAESRTNRRGGTRPGSSMPRTPHRLLAFPRAAQSCAPYYRDGICNLRDRRGAGRPQCLEPAVLRSDCGENFPAFLDQLLVFAVISGCLLVLNVAQAWLRE